MAKQRILHAPQCIYSSLAPIARLPGWSASFFADNGARVIAINFRFARVRQLWPKTISPVGQAHNGVGEIPNASHYRVYNFFTDGLYNLRPMTGWKAVH